MKKWRKTKENKPRIWGEKNGQQQQQVTMNIFSFVNHEIYPLNEMENQKQIKKFFFLFSDCRIISQIGMWKLKI